ncbi:hypothetical protein OPS25_02830 [Alteromonas ponticola]|uniref:Bacteriocin n=1 Tax=Alteromonas aquimaris TaxID=2998417 RepID=A0ABT3P3V3_9ALTE|nr:hypothetical protein [Alteromonas aquimaris]MCW8107437.1 hypothetical protein [Alteromonas aquimaris]
MDILILNDVQELNANEVEELSGVGLFYELGKSLAQVSNANDSIYRQYGNTNMNHWPR